MLRKKLIDINKTNHPNPSETDPNLSFIFSKKRSSDQIDVPASSTTIPVFEHNESQFSPVDHSSEDLIAPESVLSDSGYVTPPTRTLRLIYGPERYV